VRHIPQECCSLISDLPVRYSLIKRMAFLTNQSARGSLAVRLCSKIGLARPAREQSPMTSNPLYNPTNTSIKCSSGSQQASRFIVSLLSQKSQTSQVSDDMARTRSVAIRRESWRQRAANTRAPKVSPKGVFRGPFQCSRLTLVRRKSPRSFRILLKRSSGNNRVILLLVVVQLVSFPQRFLMPFQRIDACFRCHTLSSLLAVCWRVSPWHRRWLLLRQREHWSRSPLLHVLGRRQVREHSRFCCPFCLENDEALPGEQSWCGQCGGKLLRKFLRVFQQC